MKKACLLFLFWLLKLEAKIVLKRFKPQILAVTGSIAKSSTKEAIFAVLKVKLKNDIGKSYGNLNTKLGLPLAILGFRNNPTFWQWPFVLLRGFFRALTIKKYPKLLILEIAADLPGDFDKILSFIRPKIGIVTRIGPSHLEFFKNVKGVFKEKRKLIEALPKDGVAVLNQDDSLVYQMRNRTKAKIIFYKGDNFNIAHRAAEAVGKIFHIDQKLIQETLQKIKPLPGRMNLLSGIRNSKIIDDSYNSNPLSCRLALDFLAVFEGKRKVAILGDMLELGDFAPKAHQEIVRKANKIADSLILVGENFEKCKKGNLWYPDSGTAAKKVASQIKENDVILIKGSRGIKMEKIVERLTSRLGSKPNPSTQLGVKER